MKNYKVAPLPFQGQKRNFVEPFKKALNELKEKQNITIIVDLFGGSGLLSHTAKNICPDAKVVYNDYDDYHVRLNGINKVNVLINDIRAILGDCPRESKICPEYKNLILERIEKEEKAGFVDYITLSSSLLFSANYVTTFEELKASTLFNNVKMKDYDLASGYLNGLDIVKCDYLELFERYKDVPGVLFLVDPPYLSTDTKTYRSDAYWKLKDYLDVLNVLANNNYVFFTSDKSSLVELCEWFALNYGLDNPFAGSVLNTHNVALNKQARYTDMIFYKFVA